MPGANARGHAQVHIVRDVREIAASWKADLHFEDAVAASKVMPGPKYQQLAMGVRACTHDCVFDFICAPAVAPAPASC